MTTNNTRASWANTALSAFSLEVLHDPSAEEDEVIMGDLLVNFMHLCDAQGWDFNQLIQSARATYGEEIEEQPRATADFAECA